MVFVDESGNEITSFKEKQGSLRIFKKSLPKYLLKKILIEDYNNKLTMRIHHEEEGEIDFSSISPFVVNIDLENHEAPQPGNAGPDRS